MIRFGPKVSQIGLKWDKFWTNLTPFGPKTDHRDLADIAITRHTWNKAGNVKWERLILYQLWMLISNNVDLKYQNMNYTSSHHNLGFPVFMATVDNSTYINTKMVVCLFTFFSAISKLIGTSFGTKLLFASGRVLKIIFLKMWLKKKELLPFSIFL